MVTLYIVVELNVLVMVWCLKVFNYKDEVSILNNLNDLNPSCKTDLGHWNCLGSENLVLIYNITKLIYISAATLGG